MVTISIKYVGEEELKKKLLDFPDKSRARIDETLNRWSQFLTNYLKENHRWISRSGHLRDSHYYKKLDTGTSKIAYEVGVDTRPGDPRGREVNYGFFLEVRRIYNDKYKWFEPAYTIFSPVIIKDVEEAVKKAAKE